MIPPLPTPPGTMDGQSNVYYDTIAACFLQLAEARTAAAATQTSMSTATFATDTAQKSGEKGTEGCEATPALGRPASEHELPVAELVTTKPAKSNSIEQPAEEGRNAKATSELAALAQNSKDTPDVHLSNDWSYW